MKVILTKDQEIGREGKIVEVAAGFARNYLLPGQLAVEATEGVLRSWQGRLKAIERRQAKEKEGWKELAAKINGQALATVATASGKGKLFGSITANKISQLLLEQLGQEVDKKLIHLAEPIKEVGDFKVSIKWGPDVIAEVGLKVTARPADAEQ